MATLDDLKAVWESQDDNPRYTVNDRALRSNLQERSRRLRRVLWSNEVQNYWTSLWIAGFLAFLFWRRSSMPDAMDSSFLLALGAAAAALVYYVLFSIFFVGRRRIQPPPADFSSSLCERLNAEIVYLQHQVTARTNWKRILLHLVPPWLACIVIVWGLTIPEGEPLELINVLSVAVVTGGWIHLYVLQRRWVHRELVPGLQELVSLRRELGESE